MSCPFGSSNQGGIQSEVTPTLGLHMNAQVFKALLFSVEM